MSERVSSYTKRRTTTEAGNILDPSLKLMTGDEENARHGSIPSVIAEEEKSDAGGDNSVKQQAAAPVTAASAMARLRQSV